ncbi:MAG: Cys-tRNA(Pro) deacylase [Ruminococcaceae bacterium]|nr:Cys-tRNA(Pro) deacylase [Oscillospiraceae bacterium]
MEEKTNVMRILSQKKIPYKSYCYLGTGAKSGIEVAKVLSLSPDKVHKTLVTQGKSGENFVFVIPVAAELNLKKAANAVGEKSVAMIKESELLPKTGYVHGGCSPIGMKKQLKTVLQTPKTPDDEIIISAGKIGYQVEIKPEDLQKLVKFIYADIV